MGALRLDWIRFCQLSGRSERRLFFSGILSPRFVPVVLFRLSSFLFNSGFFRLSKAPSFLNIVIFGLEIPVSLKVGPGFVIMHPQGTVLGAAEIGSNFTVYHQVTLGASRVDFRYDRSTRPVVEDNVTISVGAKVLGGVRIGSGCTVGANAVVLVDIPPGHVAVGVPAKSFMPRSHEQHGAA